MRIIPLSDALGAVARLREISTRRFPPSCRRRVEAVVSWGIAGNTNRDSSCKVARRSLYLSA